MAAQLTAEPVAASCRRCSTFSSASELPITFGLDAAGAIDSLQVVWPDGNSQKVEGWKRVGVIVVEKTP